MGLNDTQYSTRKRTSRAAFFKWNKKEEKLPVSAKKRWFEVRKKGIHTLYLISNNLCIFFFKPQKTTSLNDVTFCHNLGRIRGSHHDWDIDFTTVTL